MDCAVECGSCVPYQPNLSCCPDWGDWDDDLLCRSIDLAWQTLHTLSGGRVGNCPVILRPCLQPPCNECAVGMPRIVRQPKPDAPTAPADSAPRRKPGGRKPKAYPDASVAGQDDEGCDICWTNTVSCGDGCSCGTMSEVVLPGPVADMWSVYVDGVVLPVSAYRVDNGNRLVRTDGRPWPSCQFMDRDPDEPGTMVVSYIPGIKPTSAGLWAAGVLTCEFGKACSGGKCRLPSSVTSIARQGVSMEFSTGMFPDGMTGIREVDAYLTSINPYGMRTPPKVWSPDLATARHRYPTWQYGPRDKGTP